MEAFVVIAAIGILFAALTGGQPTAPPPPIIYIQQAHMPPSETGCLPLLVLGLLALLVLAATQA